MQYTAYSEETHVQQQELLFLSLMSSVVVTLTTVDVGQAVSLGRQFI